MSWTEIKLTQSPPTAIERTGVEVDVKQNKDGVNPSVRFILGADVLAAMGWSIGQRVTLLRGDLADSGMVALVPTDVGGLRVRRTTAKGRMVSVQSRAAAALIPGADKAREAIRCKHNYGQITLPDGETLEALVIALPPWARNGSGGGK